MPPLRLAALAASTAIAVPVLAVLPARAADVPPPITRVTVYPGSAMVERVAQVSPGTAELVIAGLPANFDTATVRVQASNGVQVGQIVTRDVRKDEAASPREAALEEKIMALSDQRDVLNVDAQSARLVQQYLEKAPAGERAVDGKAMAGVLDAVKRGAHDSFSQQQRIQVQVRELDKKIAVLRSELDTVRSGARDQRSVTIAVAAQRAGTITLSYQVNRAGWRPAYRATLQSGASTVEMERMATVSQKTGEDWRGVELKLSTGQPRLSARAPEPQQRLLTYHKPAENQNVLAYATNVKTSPNLMRAPPAPAPAPPAPPAPGADNYIPPVIETQGNFDTEFDVPGKASLPSDGREVSLALSRLALPAKQRIRIAPRIEQAGVLTAEVERPAGIWLGGDIQLFRDGSFVGSTHWNSGAKETLSLPFGRDEQIRVTLDRAGQQSGNTGFIAQRGEHQVADVFTIRSYHRQPVDVLILESSPVSTSSDVAVQASYAPQPGIANWEQRQGVVGWEKTLAPNEAMKIDVRYKITYPKEGWVDNLP